MKIADIPLIARKAELPKERVLQLLEIEPRKRDKLILLAFRSNDLKEVDLEKIESLQGFRFVTLGLSKTYKNCINIHGQLHPVSQFVERLRRGNFKAGLRPGSGNNSQPNAPALYFQDRFC